MKKLLTVTLVFVFTLALVLAIGCAKKEQTTTEGLDQQIEQTPPAMTDTTMMTDTTSMGGQ